MPGFSAGDTTPQMMVLGLVIQKPDTVAGIARRLADQFASARWDKAAAYNNMPTLTKKGWVRVLEKGPPGEPTKDRYEATPEGVDFFRGWVRSPKLPPTVRDALQCKLELLDEYEDIAALVQLVREEEQAYTAACDIARDRVMREQRSRRNSAREPGWHARLENIRNKDEANLWGLMSKRLERLGDELERLLDDISPSRAG